LDSPDKRILVVEDDPAQARTIVLLLKRNLTATCDIAMSCAEAREKIPSCDYDLITLDYQLPDGNGLDLLEEIRDMIGPPPVVFVTGHGDEMTAVSAFKNGAAGYVVKDNRMATMVVEEARSALARADLVRAEKAVKAQRDLAVSALSAHSIEQSLDLVLDAVIEATGLDCGGIYIFDVRDSSLDLACHRGLSDEFVELTRHYDKHSDNVALVLAARPVYVDREGIPVDADDLEREGLKGMAVVPLAFGGEVIGCLNVSSRSLEQIPQDVRNIIESLSAEASQAIQREMAATALAVSEAGLRAERDRLADILNALPVGIVILDREGKLIMQNRATEELTMLSEDQLEDRKVDSPEWEITDWEGNPLPESENPFVKVLQTRERAKGVRLAALSGSGERVYVSESAAPIFDADGEIDSVILTMEDMSDLRNALEAVRQGEQLYRRTVENLNEGLWIIDPDAATLFVNDRMAEMLGYPAEELVGMSLYDFMEDEARPIMRKNLELRREGISQNYDFEFVTRDGSKIQTYLAAAPMIDGDGNFLGSHAGVLDISERKQMERALRESVMLYKTQFETSPDGVTLTDLDGTIVSASRRSAEMLGYGSPQDLLGMNSLDLIAPEQRQWAEENLLTMLDTGFVRGMEYEMLRKDSSRFVGGLSAATLKDEDGRPTGFIATIRDITKQKEAERNLASLNLELEGYAHAVSHDLKGPVSALIAASGLLKSLIDEVSEEEMRKRLDEVAAMMEGSARRAFDLISDVLTLAEGGQEPVRLEEVDIAAIVDMVLEEKSAKVRERNALVERDADLGSVRADPTHIYQLVSNLLTNGLQHNDSAEPVMRVRRLPDVGDAHRFMVYDNGSGIPPELLERVFEPFYKGEHGGAGLGLSIAQKVAGIYGGSVSAYNDEGACFEVSLKDYEAR